MASRSLLIRSVALAIAMVQATSCRPPDHPPWDTGEMVRELSNELRQSDDVAANLDEAEVLAWRLDARGPKDRVEIALLWGRPSVMIADVLRRLEGLRLKDEDGDEEILELDPPATEDEIRALEARLPCAIPGDVRDVLRVSKGTRQRAARVASRSFPAIVPPRRGGLRGICAGAMRSWAGSAIPMAADPGCETPSYAR
jgi:hypothetical protein